MLDQMASSVLKHTDVNNNRLDNASPKVEKKCKHDIYCLNCNNQHKNVFFGQVLGNGDVKTT